MTVKIKPSKEILLRKLEHDAKKKAAQKDSKKTTESK